jgi:MOSC domain-containing protein YiiM
MKLISLNIGQPQIIAYFNNPETFTAGNKLSVAQALLRVNGFEGDGVADTKNHGGPDKAVCVYSYDHYPYWEERLGKKLMMGAFSENLTLSGIEETAVCIGDIFKVGEAVVQVSQPRVPCDKLAGKHGTSQVRTAIHANGYSGFYVRVLTEGLVRGGDSVELLTRHPSEVTVAFANEVYYKQRPDRDSLRRLLAVSELAQVWRETLSQRI